MAKNEGSGGAGNQPKCHNNDGVPSEQTGRMLILLTPNRSAGPLFKEDMVSGTLLMKRLKCILLVRILIVVCGSQKCFFSETEVQGRHVFHKECKKMQEG